MRIRINLFRIAMAVVLAALAVSIPAEAQLLKKVSKGLEKVNKGLEKVDKLLDTDKNKSNNEGLIKGSNTSSQSSDGLIKGSGPAQTAVNESGWKKMDPVYPTPYFTADTKFMKVEDPTEWNISDVNDNVFSIRNGQAFEFWNVSGEKLFDAEWKYAGHSTSGTPTFSSGVTAARRLKPNADGKNPICLLYLDGHIKELDPSFESVSEFMDGIALVVAKLNYKEKIFYIDIAGNKLYPNLDVDRAVINPMRPLRDGLRAFYGTDGTQYATHAWGFIDNKGNIKIPPVYKEVTDFCNGYAWVTTDNYKTGERRKDLIDVNGKVIYTLTNITTGTSDVSDGVFCVQGRDKNIYYDLSGKEVASFREASGFYDGYAFMARGYDGADVIDRNFNVIRRMPYNEFNSNDVSYNRPDFRPYGLASIATRSIVIDSQGNILLSGYDDYNGNRIGAFSQITACGYMKAKDVYINNNRCMAFLKPTGEIAWLFAETKDFDNGGGGGGGRGPKPPFRKPRRPIDPDPPFPPEEVDRKQPPRGPRAVDKVTYTLKAVANPPEGGSVSVSPTGNFKYGDYATVTAVPNKDWAVCSVETDEEALQAPKIGEQFAVIADQTITVNFVKREDEEAPENFGTYKGQLLFEDWLLPVYAEINRKGAEENPYGTDNYGFVSIMFDPEKRYIDKKGELGVNFFAVPLKIVGIQKDKSDPSKQWLMVEGGSVTAHDIKVSPNGNPLMGMFINMMFAADGFSSVTAVPRRYRIEMLDIDPKTGEFTFGPLQTYYGAAGQWVSGDDKVLHKKTGGFFGSYTDKGYPADTFQGVKMTTSPKRNDIQWYPPESWSKNKSMYEATVEAMKNAYRSAKSDYDKLFEK